MNGGPDGAHPLWVEPGVRGTQVHPLIHPDLPAFQRRKDASLGGAPHPRRRYPGGAGRLLEGGRRAHLVLTRPAERHLHRPAALRRVQPPHKSLLSPRDRTIRQSRRPAETEAPGEIDSIHHPTPPPVRTPRQDRRRPDPPPVPMTGHLTGRATGAARSSAAQLSVPAQVLTRPEPSSCAARAGAGCHSHPTPITLLGAGPS